MRRGALVALTPEQFLAARKHAGLTQVQAGRLLGLAVVARNCQTVARYESGASPIPPAIGTLFLIVTGYRVARPVG